MTQGAGAATGSGSGGPLGRSRRSRRRWLVLGAVAVFVIAADQWTKSWAQRALAGGPHHVLGPVNLVLTFNTGAAFSLGSGVTPLVEAVAVVLVALVLWQSGRLAKGGAGWASVIGFGLLSGGALSNLADRVFRHHHGAVVDFIQLVSWWPVFNVADAALTVGAATVAVSAIFFYQPHQDRATDVARRDESERDGEKGGADLVDAEQGGRGA